MWLDLKERFQHQNRPRIFQLRRDLSNLLQDQSSVSTYFTQLKTLWAELASYRPFCTCGRCSCSGVQAISDYFQTEYVMSFLMGLNDSFSQIREQLLAPLLISLMWQLLVPLLISLMWQVHVLLLFPLMSWKNGGLLI